jgi:hypothetical protein
MAGTGYHSEGHVWEPYTGTLAGYTHICVNCAQVTSDPNGDNGECIDDH